MPSHLVWATVTLPSLGFGRIAQDSGSRARDPAITPTG